MNHQMLDVEQLRREVEQAFWWHTIDLGHGIVTPGKGNSPKTLERLHLPDDLAGQSVLDIGTFDGHFAFEAERRGAQRVLAIDLHQHEGFPIAHRALGSKAEYRDLSVMDLSREKVGQFDVVIYSGVIYHLPCPMESLLRVREVTGRLAIIETDTALNHVPHPCAEFRGERAGITSDAPNWWIFNEPCLHQMAHVAGFEQVRTVARERGREPGVLRRVREFVHSAAPRLWRPPRHTRMVVHAEV